MSFQDNVFLFFPTSHPPALSMVFPGHPLPSLPKIPQSSTLPGNSWSSSSSKHPSLHYSRWYFLVILFVFFPTPNQPSLSRVFPGHALPLLPNIPPSITLPDISWSSSSSQHLSLHHSPWYFLVILFPFFPKSHPPALTRVFPGCPLLLLPSIPPSSTFPGIASCLKVCLRRDSPVLCINWWELTPWLFLQLVQLLLSQSNYFLLIFVIIHVKWFHALLITIIHRPSSSSHLFVVHISHHFYSMSKFFIDFIHCPSFPVT